MASPCIIKTTVCAITLKVETVRCKPFAGLENTGPKLDRSSVYELKYVMQQKDHLKVSKALEVFYANQNLDQKVTSHAVNYYPLGFIKIPFPNLMARKELLYLHDLNHLLFGFNTSVSGEAQLAALELGSGFPKHCRIGYLYSPFALLPGLLLCPLKVLNAFLKGRSLKNSCHLEWSKSRILNSSLLDIKKELEHHLL